jgi:hypothetical protein
VLITEEAEEGANATWEEEDEETAASVVDHYQFKSKRDII